MAKFKSVVISKPELDEYGQPRKGVGNVGRVAWVPVDEPAKAHRLSDAAVELGAYKRETPTEREDTKKALKNREYRAQGIPEVK